ncbi:MAG: hypothetical protein AAB737_01440, partial [Patescibacteria group bacterium]
MTPDPLSNETSGPDSVVGADTSVVVWTSGSRPSVSGTGAGAGSTTGGGVGSGVGAGGASTVGADTSPSWANVGAAGNATREKIKTEDNVLKTLRG